MVHTFGDKIGGKVAMKIVVVFKRIVHLRIGHGTGIEPNINQIEFAVHRFSLRRNQHDAVGIRPVKIEALVVFVGG